jgi:hypothetical protein
MAVVAAMVVVKVVEELAVLITVVPYQVIKVLLRIF